jgi:hypothetical protein
VIINWSKVARPQHDGYDTFVLTELDALRGWSKRPVTAAVTLANGSIGCPLPNASWWHSEPPPIVLEQEWADELTRFLNRWTEGYASLISYVDEFWTWRTGRHGHGCTSGHMQMAQHEGHPRHVVYVTSDDYQGCAQGIYHEFGHLRLETCGIAVEDHNGLLLRNPATELYDSSVRKDKQRPMSAVLHGVYAWLMFMENDYHIYLANKDVARFALYAKHNIVKIEEGVSEIRRYARWTQDGQAFVDGLFEWADDLTTRCKLAF